MANYTECPQSVIHTAEDLIEQYHPMLKNCRIGFVMVDETPNSGGKKVVARVSKIPEKLRVYIPDELDMLVTISENEWAMFSEKQREALIDHELCHITIGSDAKFKTRAHDIEEFEVIIERYGLWNHDLFNAQKVLTEAVQRKLPGMEERSKPVVVQVKSFVTAAGTDK